MTSFGDSARNSGLNPLNSSVRSSAGRVRSSGISSPGSSTSFGFAAAALGQRDVALADEVAELDLRLDAGRQLAVGADRERDLGLLAVDDADLLDLADPHAGDAHVVAGQQQGRVGEAGLVAVGGAQVHVGDADREDRGRGHRDHGEDDQLDQRCDDAPSFERSPPPRGRAARRAGSPSPAPAAARTPRPGPMQLGQEVTLGRRVRQRARRVRARRRGVARRQQAVLHRPVRRAVRGAVLQRAVRRLVGERVAHLRRVVAARAAVLVELRGRPRPARTAPLLTTTSMVACRPGWFGAVAEHGLAGRPPARPSA